MFDLELFQGLQSSTWRIQSLASRLRIRKLFANQAFVLVGALISPNILYRLSRAKSYFIFGGTQFAGQWYSLNSPFYFLEAKIISLFGGKIFMGPQQYGPITQRQSAELSNFMARFATDWRTRNANDIRIFNSIENNKPGANRIIFDEVFSNMRLYPSLEPKSEKEYILVNLRSMTFDDDLQLQSESIRNFAFLLRSLGLRYSLPIVFFGVSDSTFCDDSRMYHELSRVIGDEVSLSNVGRLRDEYQLFELARSAKFALSMSFHGCILSGIAGAPFIPVTEGKYYDYKYSDFDKYTGGQQVPLVSLASRDFALDCLKIANYVDKYNTSRVKSCRQLASGMLDLFYNSCFALIK